MRKKKKRKLNYKKIITPLFLLLCIILIFYLLNNTFKQADGSENIDKPIYATVKSAQDAIIEDNTPLSNVVNNNGKTFVKAIYQYSTFITSRVDENELFLSVSSLAKNVLLNDNMAINPDTEYKVSGISSNIKDVFVSHFGTVTDYPVIIVLYENGNAQFIDVEKSFYEGNFEIAGNINITNISKFETVNVTKDNNLLYIGIVAIDSQGNAYEITKEELKR